MILERYTHISIFLEGRLYVIGGRQWGGEPEALRNECEYFDFRIR